MGKEGEREDGGMMKRPSRSGRGLRVIEAVPSAAMCVYCVRVYITAAGRGTAAGAMSTGWDKIIVLPKYYVSEEISNSLHFFILSMQL